MPQISLMQMFGIALEESDYRLEAARHRFGASRRSPLVLAVVNGPPKTGTTWMARMISDIPGFFRAGNLQGNLVRLAAAPPGSVVHSHDEFSNELQACLEAADARVVTLIRDPRDQVVSHLFHIRRVANHAWHHELSQMPFDDALLACIVGRASPRGDDAIPPASRVADHHLAWIGADLERVQPVRYEELLSATVPVFSRVADRLGVPVNRRLAQAIVERNRFERLTIGRALWRPMRPRGSEDASAHVRSGVAGGWRRYFKPAHVEAFKEVAGHSLVALGYESGLEWGLES
jgi:hypothetical protein